MPLCAHCGADVPALAPDPAVFERLVTVLANGSPTLAAYELQAALNCPAADANTWVEHLLACIHAWPTAAADAAVLEALEAAFATVDKPEHFTNFTHCDECLEHDETLRARDRKTLQRDDLGNAGWDPLCFCSADGIAYFFPALARIALLPDVWRGRDWYAPQLLWHVAYEGDANRFLAWCSDGQRRAVAAFLQHLQASRAEAINRYGAEDDVATALAVWEAAVPARRAHADTRDA